MDLKMSLMFPKENYKKDKKRENAIKLRNRKKNKAIVIIRAGGMCENPDCNNEADGGCHHIIFLSEGGSDETDNMIALCVFCHNKAHSKVRGVNAVEFMVVVLSLINAMCKSSKYYYNSYYDKGIFIFMASYGALLKKPCYLRYKAEKNKEV